MVITSIYEEAITYNVYFFFSFLFVKYQAVKVWWTAQLKLLLAMFMILGRMIF